jgi:hypothetical protein
VGQKQAFSLKHLLPLTFDHREMICLSFGAILEVEKINFSRKKVSLLKMKSFHSYPENQL